ncbi:hypothetical protein [Pseudomonas haemolytica]|jgi:hypothetical protein|uniref:Uncharacterized protein n=1 Tax=Pseudomonas haemolytica TaxID=2600065 RepID=A0ABS1H0B1_9PSED|nr:hypothetical protein [Pseudomonas haemolytica]MBK3462635.1 hypothetical protein [Pseudomonas haemolytica]
MSENSSIPLTLKTNEKSVEFEIELSMKGYEIFSSMVKQKHYLFNRDLMRLRTAYILANGHELKQTEQLSVDRLAGMVHLISLKNYQTPADLDILELHYIVEKNTFFFKFLSSVSYEFDYIAEYKKSKGA